MYFDMDSTNPQHEIQMLSLGTIFILRKDKGVGGMVQKMAIFTYFTKPFVWSVTQLVRFFQDPKMANLLTGPGTQQQPL